MNLTPVYLKWREETLQEGRQEQGMQLIIRQLTRRVGELSPEVRSRLTTLSLSQLDTLGEALLDFNRIEDLNHWLQVHTR
jgi:predicted transposase YdaD